MHSPQVVQTKVSRLRTFAPVQLFMFCAINMGVTMSNSITFNGAVRVANTRGRLGALSGMTSLS